MDHLHAEWILYEVGIKHGMKGALLEEFVAEQAKVHQIKRVPALLADSPKPPQPSP